MKTRILGIVLGVLIGVPAVAFGSSFTYSLVEGKTPSEAINIIAANLESLTGRVSSLESGQAALSQQTASTTGDVQVELDKLKQENADLQKKTQDVLDSTASIRAKDTRATQCADFAVQISQKESVVKQPYLAQMQPLRDQLNTIKAPLYNASTTMDEAVAIKAQVKAKQKEIDAIGLQMEHTVDTLNATPEMKALHEQADKLLCA